MHPEEYAKEMWVYIPHRPTPDMITLLMWPRHMDQLIRRPLLLVGQETLIHPVNNRKDLVCYLVRFSNGNEGIVYQHIDNSESVAYSWWIEPSWCKPLSQASTYYMQQLELIRP